MSSLGIDYDPKKNIVILYFGNLGHFQPIEFFLNISSKTTNNFNNLTGYFFLETYDFNQNYNSLSIVLNQKSEVSKINSKCWDRLSSMAFETYVPESETSKSGAGY